MSLNPFRWAMTQFRQRCQAGLAKPEHLDRLYERVAAAIQIQGALQGLPVVRPMPGWALSTDAIVWILSDLQERSSPSLVEFGCGQSTVIFAAWLRGHGGGRFVSFEHDPAHAAAIRAQLEACKLSEFVDLQVVGISDRPAEDGLPACKSYVLPEGGATFDVALVDGPPYFFGDATRYHPLRWAVDHLNGSGAAYLDDTIRVAERRVVQALVAQRPGTAAQEIATANGLARLTRKAAR